ncbi:hypothetical protein SAMN06265222_12052 [Neorhodopirellula lusitana]|uniref:Uncharacterized protein n=1 Tax=Neorhodopirellula lusitana TaxID=445327 RepID=A0ABY1QN06_9BACT|nr:hypothetical protein SAMN06265222_12052 [Neorhodopirellula lusitana]
MTRLRGRETAGTRGRLPHGGGIAGNDLLDERIAMVVGVLFQYFVSFRLLKDLPISSVWRYLPYS